MLSQLAKTFYPVINLLPERSAMRLKVLLQVLFREYTFMVPAFPVSQNFREGVPDDVEAALPGIDPASLAQVQDFLHRIRMDLILQDAGISRDSLLVRRSFLESELIVVPAHFGALRKARRKYKFIGNVESLIYQHGFSLLSSAAKEYAKGKIFVDAGASNGSCSIPLMKYKPSKIIAFEPFPQTAEEYRQNMRRYGFSENEYEVCVKALGDKPEIMNYDPENIKLSTDGTTPVEVTTLDLFFKDRQDLQIGFIKADLEGFGLAMLKGGIETIKRTRPVLGLACYHTPEELFGQYRFLKQELSNYNFRYTSLPPGKGYELTLLAIPAEAEQ